MQKLQTVYNIATSMVKGDSISKYPCTPDECTLILKPILLPEKEVDEAIDKLLIKRGENPSSVRNPYYKQERQLAKDLLRKYVTLK